RKRVARIDRLEEAEVGVAEVGNCIEGNVRHRLAEHHMEDEEIVDRRMRKAEGARELVGGLHREAGAIERVVERDVADRDGARRRVLNPLAETKVLKEIAGIGFAGFGRAGIGLAHGRITEFHEWRRMSARRLTLSCSLASSPPFFVASPATSPPCRAD